MGKILSAIKFLASNDALTADAAESLLKAMAKDAPEFREEDHPRDESGRFTSGNGGGSKGSSSSSGLNVIVKPKNLKQEGFKSRKLSKHGVGNAKKDLASAPNGSFLRLSEKLSPVQSAVMTYCKKDDKWYPTYKSYTHPGGILLGQPVDEKKVSEKIKEGTSYKRAIDPNTLASGTKSLKKAHPSSSESPSAKGQKEASIESLRKQMEEEVKKEKSKSQARGLRYRYEDAIQDIENGHVEMPKGNTAYGMTIAPPKGFEKMSTEEKNRTRVKAWKEIQDKSSQTFSAMADLFPSHFETNRDMEKLLRRKGGPHAALRRENEEMLNSKRITQKEYEAREKAISDHEQAHFANSLFEINRSKWY